MATLSERARAQRLSRLNPNVPDFTPPPGTTRGEVEAAVALRERVQAAVEDVAHGILAEGRDRAAAGLENDRLIWAQKAIVSSGAQGDTLLRAILAEFEAPTDATDQDLLDFIVGLVPALALGIRK